jgi:Tfp pilus assembly protein PilF
MPSVETDQDQCTIHLDRAATLMKLRKLDAAVKELRQALRVNPQHPDAHHMLAVIYWSQGKLHEAKKEVETALHLSPGTAKFFNTLGGVVGRLGMKEADDHFRRALALEPEAQRYHFCYAEWLVMVGRMDTAWEETEIALRLDPQDADTHWLQAMILFSKEKYPEAEQSALKALANDPQHADSHTLLGDIYMLTHRGGKALLSYRSSLRLQPGNKPLKRKIVLALQARVPILGLFWKISNSLDRFPNRAFSDLLFLILVALTVYLVIEGGRGGLIFVCVYCIPFLAPVLLLIWVVEPLLTRAFLNGWIKIDETDDANLKKGINARLAPFVKAPIIILVMILTMVCAFIILYNRAMNAP